MVRYKDGLKVATHIFEAAAWQYTIRVTCGACKHSTVFDPHQLWWLFRKKSWDDDLKSAPGRFWCRPCATKCGRKVKRATLLLVTDEAEDHGLPFPDIGEWKRAVSRFRS